MPFHRPPRILPTGRGAGLDASCVSSSQARRWPPSRRGSAVNVFPCELGVIFVSTERCCERGLAAHSAQSGFWKFSYQARLHALRWPTASGCSSRSELTRPRPTRRSGRPVLGPLGKQTGLLGSSGRNHQAENAPPVRCCWVWTRGAGRRSGLGVQPGPCPLQWHATWTTRGWAEAVGRTLPVATGLSLLENCFLLRWADCVSSIAKKSAIRVTAGRGKFPRVGRDPLEWAYSWTLTNFRAPFPIGIHGAPIDLHVKKT